MNTLRELFHNNQFLSSGFVLLFTGALFAYAKAVPGRIAMWFRVRSVSSLTLEATDNGFQWVRRGEGVSWLVRDGGRAADRHRLP